MITVKILLWNVWCLPSLLTDRRTRSRAAAISPLLNTYDIIILNEAFVHKDLLLQSCSHPHRFIPPKPRLRIFDSGLIFLSKYPITDTGFEPFKCTASIDCVVAKGIGFCTVRLVDPDGIDHGALQVFGTHMQSERTNAAQAARREQALQVGSFVVSKRAKDGSPAVLAGDLNMGPRLEEGFSLHYSDEKDADQRCASYQSMVEKCGFREVGCADGRYGSEICRFLAQGVEDCGIEYVGRGSLGEGALSDTDGMCLTVQLVGGDSVSNGPGAT